MMKKISGHFILLKFVVDLANLHDLPSQEQILKWPLLNFEVVLKGVSVI